MSICNFPYLQHCSISHLPHSVLIIQKLPESFPTLTLYTTTAIKRSSSTKVTKRINKHEINECQSEDWLILGRGFIRRKSARMFDIVVSKAMVCTVIMEVNTSGILVCITHNYMYFHHASNLFFTKTAYESEYEFSPHL